MIDRFGNTSWNVTDAITSYDLSGNGPDEKVTKSDRFNIADNQHTLP